MIPKERLTPLYDSFAHSPLPLAYPWLRPRANKPKAGQRVGVAKGRVGGGEEEQKESFLPFLRIKKGFIKESFLRSGEGHLNIKKHLS